LRDRVATGRLVRRTSAALVPPPPWAFATFGDGSIIVPPARVESPQHIAIGSGVIVHEFAWLLARDVSGHPAPALTIGDGVHLNRFVKIVCCGEVTIGANSLLSDRVYISDVEYVPGEVDVDPAARSLTEPRPVVIERGAFLGVGAVVKPGVVIGERAYVSAGAIVEIDVPPHSLAVGAPARVVRRFDPPAQTN
jgi:acetyltransferase-like isoleucine patch superfamily enzyme